VPPFAAYVFPRELIPQARGSIMGSAPQRLGDLSLGALIVWFAGIMMGVMGGATLLQSLRSGDSPTEVTCARLGRLGPPGSHYVTLTQYSARWEGSLSWTNDKGRCTYVLVPLCDRDQSLANVLAKVYWPESEDSVRQMLSQPTLSGMIEQRGLDGDSCANLSRANPGLDPEKCWVFHPGGKPYDVRWMSLLFLAGIALHTASLFLFALPRPQGQTAMVVSMMVPLIALVDGLHALANRLPLSRRMWGVILMPPSVAVAAYGGYQYSQLALGNAIATEAGDLLASFAIVMGSSFSILALAFLVTEPPVAAAVEPAANSDLPSLGPGRRAGF
jgi:hypothetical protein